MSGNDEEVQGEEGSWKSEHDAIQLQLKQMKEQFLKDTEVLVKPETGPEPEPAPEPKPSEPARASGEMSIKEMFKSGIYKTDDDIDEGEPLPPARTPSKERKEPPRLEEGKIPVARDLTEKIANVIQLEDKLKRRKYELEKKQARSSFPPPPISPVSRAEDKNKGPINGPYQPSSRSQPTRAEQSQRPEGPERPGDTGRKGSEIPIQRSDEGGSRPKAVDRDKSVKAETVDARSSRERPQSSISKEEKQEAARGSSPEKERNVENERREKDHGGGAWKKLKGLFSK